MIPLILVGAAGLIGWAGHESAKETNEQAQSIARDAQSLYNSSKNSLEAAQNSTKEELIKLGYQKKDVLEGSIKSFLTAYERIKDVELSESVGLHEIANFDIDQQDALQLQQMTDIRPLKLKRALS